MLALRIAVLVCVFLGSIAGADLIWNLADGIMGLMAFINLIAVVLLSGLGMRLVKDYTRQRRDGKDPVFTRDLFPAVKNIECWEDERSVTGVIPVVDQDGVSPRRR